MANILLTERCVRSCPYCFAKEHMAGAEEKVLAWEDLIYLADFFEASGEKAFSLLGGEPTLHPHFVDFVLYLVERGFRVNVFTSGITSNSKLAEMSRYLSNIHPAQLSFVVNLNDPKKSPYSEVENVKRFLRAFGHLASAGFNIYRHDFDMTFLVKYINEFGLKRHIRLGLAHPIPGQKNVCVKTDDMQAMANNFMSQVPLLERFQIDPGFDCGFPMCLLSDADLGRLFRLNRGMIKFSCGPTIDVGPDMSVWTCFPLSNYQKTSIYDFDSIQQLRAYYDRLHKKVRAEVGGVFEACDTCKYRENGLCAGGCLSHAISKFINEAPIRFKEIYNDPELQKFEPKRRNENLPANQQNNHRNSPVEVDELLPPIEMPPPMEMKKMRGMPPPPNMNRPPFPPPNIKRGGRQAFPPPPPRKK